MKRMCAGLLVMVWAAVFLAGCAVTKESVDRSAVLENAKTEREARDRKSTRLNSSHYS